MNRKRILATTVAVMFIAPGLASAAPPVGNPMGAWVAEMMEKVLAALKVTPPGRETKVTTSLKTSRNR